MCREMGKLYEGFQEFQLLFLKQGVCGLVRFDELEVHGRPNLPDGHALHDLDGDDFRRRFGCLTELSWKSP